MNFQRHLRLEWVWKIRKAILELLTGENNYGSGFTAFFDAIENMVKKMLVLEWLKAIDKSDIIIK